MASRYNAQKGAGGKADLGYQEGEQVAGVDIPSCTIEDVDRSVFNLFENDLNFTIISNKKPIKIPVIFATGERFALLARKKPLRDSSGALILPLISIMRTGVSHAPGIGENVPLVVKRRLAPEDAEFQIYANKQGIVNSDELATPKSAFSSDGISEEGKKISKPGVASPAVTNPQIKDSAAFNIFEIFEIPPVKHYKATYAVTFWCQYTQQMNQVMTIFMGGYTNNNKPSFRLDTKKGYYFSCFVDDALSPDVNFEDFTEEERIVKCTMTLSVNAYLVAPRSIGQPTPVRRYVSAPHISFTMHSMSGIPKQESSATVDSNNPNDYTLQDLSHELVSNPKQEVGGVSTKEIRDNLDSLGTTTLNSNIGSMGTVQKIVSVDPTSGKKNVIEVKIADQNQKTGETVFRAKGFVIKLDDLIRK